VTPGGGEVWSAGDVEEYERTRYRNLDQRLVDRLERRALARLVDRRARPGDDVLDMPSGYGRAAGVLAGPGRRVVAADRSAEMLRAARRRGAAAGGHVGADARALPFPDAAFDGVVCLRLVQHLPDEADRAAVFGEVARVAARWAVISAYRTGVLHHLQRRLLGRDPMCVPLGRLRRELREAGFRVERVSRPIPFLHAQTLMLLRPA
jgi:ubiquinone/menaquinone biosynthesis C-methylase UbiE